MLLVQFPEYILLIVTGKGESQQKNWFEQLGNDARYMWFLQLKCGISLRTNSSLSILRIRLGLFTNLHFNEIH